MPRNNGASTPAPIRMRPHHFICAVGFEGKGYSDVFTANMAALIDQLRAPSGADIRLLVVQDTDDICAPCPQRRGTLCESQAKIARLDNAHAAALSLSPGDELSWGEAEARIAARVTPDDLDQLCAGCQWLAQGMCKRALTLLRDKHRSMGQSSELGI